MPLDELFPRDVLEALSARAAALGRPRPTRAADIHHGVYADLLWTYVERDAAPNPSEAWRAHGQAAVQRPHSCLRRVHTGDRAGGGTDPPAVDRALRAALPLTAGQLAAAAVTEGDASSAALRRAGQAAIARAREEGRPVEPALLGPGRDRTLGEALTRARRRGPNDPLIQRLARELASARFA
jgi:hypothetical protein